MRAIMSDKLRRIIRDPQGNRALQKGLSTLDVKKSTVILAGGHHYKIQFLTAESRAK